MKQIVVKPVTYNLKVLAACILSAGLTACGGGGGGGSSASVDVAPAQVDEVVLSGSVGDGPVAGASVSVYASNGKLLTTFLSDSSARYTVKFKIPNGSYPLMIEAVGGTDLVTGTTPDFTLTSTAVNNSVTEVNINPYSTLIVAAAGNMPGGMKESNINTAKQIIMSKMNYGLDSALVPDPINSPLTTENIANLVKASETLGEMIRRTRDGLVGTGSAVSADGVIQALSSDLSDGALDGKGGKGADARVTAVANLTTGQVAIEAMSNGLRVNGVTAAPALDYSIKTSLPSTPSSQLTDSVRVNSGLMMQAKASVAAAYAVSPSLSLSTLSSALDRVVVGSDPLTVSQVVPSDSSLDLTQAVSLAAVATTQELDVINTASTTPVPQTTSNTPPAISGTSLSVALEDTQYSFTPVASDADGDTLSFSITNRPVWAAFNTTTGRLSGTPTNDHVGTTSNITISVTDGVNTSSIGPFSITVQNVNDAPVISGISPSSIQVGQAYSFSPSAGDVDGDVLAFSITNRPVWAAFDSDTGRLYGTPGTEHAGVYANITISVSDGKAVTALPAFSLTVTSVVPANRAPIVSNSPATAVQQDATYSYTPSVSDPDGDALTFTIANKPVWATFTSGTGRLGGVPGNAHVGTTSGIVITVSDGKLSTSIGPFSITVINKNDAPVVTNVPATQVNEDSAYSFTPAASDPDGDSLTFSIVNRPSWASFNASTGRLSGTPTNANVGTTTGIAITVSDGNASVTIGPFSVTVINTNDAPTISGSPTTSAVEGQTYSFTPSASDIDGDTLTFSITNRPNWATFNTSTGALSGVPSASHVGTSGNIVISVSDGKSSAALSGFTITVASAQPKVTNVVLSWVAPTKRTDGTALAMSAIGGYVINYGNTAGVYTTQINVADAYTMSYTLTSLPKGTYYFAVTAYDTQGRSSGYSSSVSTVIQ